MSKATLSREDGIELSKTKEENERQRPLQTMHCAMFLVAFWLVVLWLVYTHDDKMVIIGLCLASSVMIFFFGSMCFIVFVAKPSTQTNIENDDDGYEMTEQDEQQSTLMDSLGRNVETQGALFAYSFDQTPSRIRQCQEYSNPDNVPSNGTYKIVYNTVVFGRHVRSEGFLHLTFNPYNSDRSHKNGWQIKGSTGFGNRTVTILDGFLNTEGLMYWTMPMLCTKQNDRKMKFPVKNVTIYRGKWNLENQCWEGGEFQSFIDSSISIEGRPDGPEGSIVLMEPQSRNKY
jgi:hypothetical protein